MASPPAFFLLKTVTEVVFCYSAEKEGINPVGPAPIMAIFFIAVFLRFAMRKA
jgi:hypothetical protein